MMSLPPEMRNGSRFGSVVPITPPSRFTASVMYFAYWLCVTVLTSKVGSCSIHLKCHGVIGNGCGPESPPNAVVRSIPYHSGFPWVSRGPSQILRIADASPALKQPQPDCPAEHCSACGSKLQ